MKAAKAKPAYAKVVVDVPSRAVSGAFDYGIPPHLGDDARVGAMVAVPFGPSHRVGYVVDLVEKPDVAKVLPIDAVLERGPVFDEHVLALCRWVAAYYLATTGDALRLAVPPGRGRRLVRKWRLAEDGAGTAVEESGAGTAAEDTGARADVLAALRRLGAASMTQLGAVAGARARKEITDLAREGLVEPFYETSRAGAREKTVEYAKLAVQGQEGCADLCRAPKQAAIVELLQEFGSMPVPTLLAESGASRASLRALATREIVEIERHVVRRQPDGGLSSQNDRDNAGGKQLVNLTEAQDAALCAISEASGSHECFLLDGVTGSGKTEVYIRAVQEQLAAGRGGIILVPEISLTPQTVSRFRERLGDEVAVMHSGLSLGERHDEWMAVRAGRRRVVVGARSAVFAPVPDLGIIVVDEEHETSYKQSSTPRYHARDVAIERARLSGCAIVLGSATPSLESRRQVELGKMRRLVLPERVGGRPMPKVEIVDMREEFAAGNRSVFSDALQQAMGNALESGEKVILFVNRRGFSSFLLCRDCGFVPSCPRCAVSLVYHDRGRQLRCHHCDFAQGVPATCPECGSVYLRHFGIGTQRVEDEVRATEPGTLVVRMDADTTKTKDGHAHKLREFVAAPSGVLLGTQMVAKGHDFPEVTVVGVVNADTALGMPDFRAAERTFQLLAQVSGRAGRGDIAGRVIIQTYWPDHYAIQAVATGDFEGFYCHEQEIRRLMEYPPFVPLINIGFAGADLEQVRLAAQAAGKLVREMPDGLVTVMGPAPAPLERIAGRHRWHLALKLHDEQAAKQELSRVLERLESFRRRGVTIAVDVDPVSMA